VIAIPCLQRTNDEIYVYTITQIIGVSIHGHIFQDIPNGKNYITLKVGQVLVEVRSYDLKGSHMTVVRIARRTYYQLASQALLDRIRTVILVRGWGASCDVKQMCPIFPEKMKSTRSYLGRLFPCIACI